MVNLDELKGRGLRAYEVGRLRVAGRIALVVVPAAAVCLLDQRSRETCACLSVLLLGLCVWLRWRDRRGMEDVTTGLMAGSIPLVAGLILGRLDGACSGAVGAILCQAFSGLVGLLGGVLIGVRETRQNARFWSWFTTLTVAALTASIGCARLGLAGLLSALVGVAVGTAATAVIRKTMRTGDA